MLAHQSAGEGIPFLLFHAFPLSSAMWAAEIPRLAHRCRVVAPDLPGFGGSPRQEKPSIAGMAQEAAALLDHLGIREPVVAGGLSMGGYVTFEYLRQFPERVRALALISTRAAADTPEARAKRLKAVEEIRAKGLEAFSRAVLPNLVGKTTLSSRPEVCRRVTELILANRPEGVADALLAMAARRDSADLLELIRVPTLVVAGDEDTFIPVDEARALQGRIRGCRLEVIPQAGHLVNLEQPARFQQALEQFLGSAHDRCRRGANNTY
ncbi:MAG: alpha/beta fold hydrolase [Candidatus Omnitrophica bacterium]|nr:alpha/beta fold hydrolase [Candidatus Omnitrophota bacterium]